jgi:hypothetical protein
VVVISDARRIASIIPNGSSTLIRTR